MRLLSSLMSCLLFLLDRLKFPSNREWPYVGVSLVIFVVPVRDGTLDKCR